MTTVSRKRIRIAVTIIVVIIMVTIIITTITIIQQPDRHIGVVIVTVLRGEDSLSRHRFIKYLVYIARTNQEINKLWNLITNVF